MSGVPLRANAEIRARVVRVIGSEGQNFGVLTIREAIQKANEVGLDLVEVEPNKEPPVCKIMDFGKFRYSRNRRDKENKKSQSLTKTKEIKLRPNIDQHDVEIKVRKAKTFLEKGHKVRITCVFRARELMHSEIGVAAVESFCQSLSDVGVIETPMSLLGRTLSVVFSPAPKKKRSVDAPKDLVGNVSES